VSAFIDTSTTDAAPATGAAGSTVLAVFTLTERELVRFFRQRTRVISALGQPIIFWVLFGAGLRDSFRAPGFADVDAAMSYQEYFFPGVAVMIVMFTAIFSTITVIEDRREGFLQGVLVAPIPRWAIVLGKLCGGTVLAVLQAGLFLVIGPALHIIGLAPAMQIDVAPVSVVLCAGFLILLSFQLTALGYMIAWRMDSTHGFHAIMSVFLLPMWLLSGAFFPASESGWLSWVIRLNPLTYGVAGLRRILYANAIPASDAVLPQPALCVLVTVVVTAIYVALCIVLTRTRFSHDAR